MGNIKKIAVLTSGGDAPGMNACIRSVTRSAIFKDMEVYGVMRGYQGLMEGKFVELKSNSVSNIIQRGGTILKSARCKEFLVPKGREKAARVLKKNKFDALIVIGGDGTFRGAKNLYEEQGFPVIGAPGTIDNDLFGTDYTIGYDTAVNTAMDAVDRLRDTADSHNRVFFIEVMGRDAGFIALDVGLSGGAEAVLIPETKTDLNYVTEILKKGWKRHKTSSIIIVSEGGEEGGAFEVVEKIKDKIPTLEYRVSILGHIQRGGKPTVRDRILGSRLGYAAVSGLQKGMTNVMVGIKNDEVVYVPLRDAIEKRKEINSNLIYLSEILSN